MPRPSGSVERRTALDRRHGGRGRIDTLQRHLREVPANLSDFRSRTHPEFGQSVPLRATRCYLLDRLYLALTCMNHCFCWSPLEGNMTPVCCCSDTRYHCATRPCLLFELSPLTLRALAAPSVAQIG